MSTEEDVLLDNTADEQFKYVRRGYYSNIRNHDRSGVRTIVALLIIYAAGIVFNILANHLRQSHEIESTPATEGIIYVLPYIGAAFIFVTALIAVALLFLTIMCLGPLIDSNLSVSGAKLLLGTVVALLIMSGATTMYMWWLYSI